MYAALYSYLGGGAGSIPGGGEIFRQGIRSVPTQQSEEFD